MKTISFFLCGLLILATPAYSKEKTTILNLTVENGADPMVYYSIPGGQTNDTDTLRIDRTGILEIELKDISSVFFLYSGNVARFFIEPGKNYNFTFSGEKISSDNPIAQKYSDLAHSRSIYTYEFVRDYTEYPLDTIGSNMLANFEGLIEQDRALFENDEMAPGLRNAIYKDIESFWVMNLSKVFRSNYRNFINGTPMYPDYGETWKTLYEKYPVSRDYLLSMWVRSYAEIYFMDYKFYADGVTGVPPLETDAITETYNRFYPAFTDPVIKKELFTQLLAYDIINDNTMQPALGRVIDKFLADYPDVRNREFFEAHKEYIQKYQEIIKGDFSPFVKFLPDHHDYTKLTDVISFFKGKPVFIDFWFAGCGPCREEFQQSGELKKFLKENGIESLYISIDSDDAEKDWENTIKYFDLAGYHIRTSDSLREELFKSYEIYFFPYYMLVDADGKIVVSPAKRPSEGDALFSQIKELFGL